MSVERSKLVSAAWSGRFAEPVSDLVKRYTGSVNFDQRMWPQDIRGSLAHARMLCRQGIISATDFATIERGMAQIVAEVEGGKFEWTLDAEDVHLNIERRLTALIGDAGNVYILVAHATIKSPLISDCGCVMR